MPHKQRRRSLRAPLILALAFGVVGVAVIAEGLRRLATPPDEQAIAASHQMSMFVDIGRSLTADIQRVVDPAILRTQRCAASPDVVQALRSGNRQRLTDECNSIITDSTEIDAIAMFDASGQILSMNSVYADGRPIEQERIDRILNTNFDEREIIQRCARNDAQAGVLEFQTTCDITPALFDSVGLSIAYSMPVFDPDTGAKLGVVSTRLRFERLSGLIQARRLGEPGDAMEFVTDRGQYFSETINSGTTPAPLPVQELAASVAPLVTGHAEYTIQRHDSSYVGLFRMNGLETLEGGGVQVLLVLGQDALQDEAILARRILGTKVVGAGVACLLVSLAIYGLSRLRASDARTIRLIEDSNDAIITVDPSDVVLTWNTRAQTMLGYTRAEAIGRPLTPLLMPDHTSGPWLAGLAAQPSPDHAVSGGPHREAVVRRKDGTPVTLELSLSIHTGRERGCLSAFARDITERKQLETHLAQAQKLESIGVLAAGIAHEINTPIQYIGDNVRFLRDQFAALIRVVAHYEGQLETSAAPLDWNARRAEITRVLQELDFAFLQAEVPVAIDQSLDGLGRVASIVSAMKDFSHPGSTGKEMGDLNKAIASTVIVCTHRWKYVARVQLDLDPALPQVPCILAELNQVILNLVVNAADAIAEKRGADGPLGSIRVSTRHVGSHVEIRVQDDAGGIPESARAKIFSPFFTTKPVGKGTGQGLAISRNVIVTRHGGSIRFQTATGEGTTFIITLPLATEQTTPASDAAPRAAA